VKITAEVEDIGSGSEDEAGMAFADAETMAFFNALEANRGQREREAEIRQRAMAVEFAAAEAERQRVLDAEVSVCAEG